MSQTKSENHQIIENPIDRYATQKDLTILGLEIRRDMLEMETRIVERFQKSQYRLGALIVAGFSILSILKFIPWGHS